MAAFCVSSEGIGVLFLIFGSLVVRNFSYYLEDKKISRPPVKIENTGLKFHTILVFVRQ